MVNEEKPELQGWLAENEKVSSHIGRHTYKIPDVSGKCQTHSLYWLPEFLGDILLLTPQEWNFHLLTGFVYMDISTPQKKSKRSLLNYFLTYRSS